jgi:hypothetical protein
MGTAKIKIGIAKLAMRFIGFGSNLKVNVAINKPKKSAPASPMYMRAGGLFHTRKPMVAPARTIDKAAIKN